MLETRKTTHAPPSSTPNTLNNQTLSSTRLQTHKPPSTLQTPDAQSTQKPQTISTRHPNPRQNQKTPSTSTLKTQTDAHAPPPSTSTLKTQKLPSTTLKTHTDGHAPPPSTTTLKTQKLPSTPKTPSAAHAPSDPAFQISTEAHAPPPPTTRQSQKIPSTSTIKTRSAGHAPPLEPQIPKPAQYPVQKVVWAPSYVPCFPPQARLPEIDHELCDMHRSLAMESLPEVDVYNTLPSTLLQRSRFNVEFNGKKGYAAFTKRNARVGKLLDHYTIGGSNKACWIPTKPSQKVFGTNGKLVGVQKQYGLRFYGGVAGSEKGRWVMEEFIADGFEEIEKDSEGSSVVVLTTHYDRYWGPAEKRVEQAEARLLSSEKKFNKDPSLQNEKALGECKDKLDGAVRDLLEVRREIVMDDNKSAGLPQSSGHGGPVKDLTRQPITDDDFPSDFPHRSGKQHLNI